MKILLVEEDEQGGKYLEKSLAESAYVVDWLKNGKDGLVQALADNYNLLILAVQLPYINGLDVLHGVRRSGKDVPVLMISSRHNLDERIKAFDLGGDDHIVKPFPFAELLARVRSLLRRSARTREPEVLYAADLELDLIKRKVSRSGKKIDLTAKEFALLDLLLRRQGEVLSHSLISSQIWGMNFDSETNVLPVTIRRLRSKIDDEFEPKLIRTIRGIGYVLELNE